MSIHNVKTGCTKDAAGGASRQKHSGFTGGIPIPCSGRVGPPRGGNRKGLKRMTNIRLARQVTVVLANGFLCGALWGQSAEPASGQAGRPAAAAAPVRYMPKRFSGHAQMFYQGVWGIDSLSVKWAESGEMVRFSWRVLDPQKAKPLNDKKVEPALQDPQAGVSLVVPSLEKVGQLRQAGQSIEAGKSYWMAFSNVGRRVRRGDRVNVVIGNFRAQGLVVTLRSREREGAVGFRILK